MLISGVMVLQIPENKCKPKNCNRLCTHLPKRFAQRVRCLLWICLLSGNAMAAYAQQGARNQSTKATNTTNPTKRTQPRPAASTPAATPTAPPTVPAALPPSTESKPTGATAPTAAPTAVAAKGTNQGGAATQPVPPPAIEIKLTLNDPSKPTSAQGSIVLTAPASLGIGPIFIDSGTTLTPEPVPFDSYECTPYELAVQVLKSIRQAARSTEQTRQAVKKSKLWKPLLLPQRNLLSRKFTSQRRRKRAQFLRSAELQIDKIVGRMDSASKQNSLRQAGAIATPGAAASANPAQPPAVDAAQPSVLYSREFVVAARPTKRILQLTIQDRGAGTAARNEMRYMVCARYTTDNASQFVSITSVAGSCPPQMGFVTANVALSQMDSRELFVEKVRAGFNVSAIVRMDGEAKAAYNTWKAANESLLQSFDKEQVILDTLKNRRLTKSKLDFALQNLADTAKAKQSYTTRRTTVIQAIALSKTDSIAARTATIDATKKNQTALDAVQKLSAGANLLLEKTDDFGELNNALLDAYLDYARQQERYLLAPKAGVVELEKTIEAFPPRGTRPRYTFLLDSVQMEVEDGHMMNLKATGTLDDGQPVVFETYAPIGLSSDRDLNREWRRQRLQSQYPIKNRGAHHEDAYIRLTDLIRYYPALAPEAGDRSPANNVYIFRPADPLPKRTLPKIETTKILQARLYTDLAGVKSDNPNGLIQVEVSKKFVFGSPWSKISPNYQFQALSYLTPSFSLNKIEQQNRYLTLSRISRAPLLYGVHTIDLLRYTNLRIGVDLNLLGVRLPRYKLDASLDFSAHLNRVDLRDSLNRPGAPVRAPSDTTLNVASYGLGVKLRIRPDSRYGLQLRVGLYRYSLINDRENPLLIRQSPDPVSTHSAYTLLEKYIYQGVIQYEITGRVSLSPNSELFIRPQLSQLLFQAQRTYFQCQFGYQFDVFSRRREAPAGIASLLPSAR
ncbi:hypothetical protein [Hymenobacter convexus]|uniref:hypothetical protein n=1 Tax=Hymenobacter sp. CA1UV-4 TaxID=3063782 RepID=UPI00271306EE|nr:hypothetical protein [Hymenobacter sp. CA1UV-4]MDO7850938.1 hypothetical protein [Hymenobacter sp. CA1UV-4]